MNSPGAKARRRAWPLLRTAGSRHISPTKSTSQAPHGARRRRSSPAPSRPPWMNRRWAWRATHSSWPTAGPSAGTWEERGVESVTSDLADVGPPEQALRAEDHERDQDREDDQVGPFRRDVALRVRLGEAEEQPPGHR